MTERQQETPRLTLDWDRVRELRRIFWDAEIRKAEIRLRLTRLLAERKKLEGPEDPS